MEVENVILEKAKGVVECQDADVAQRWRSAAEFEKAVLAFSGVDEMPLMRELSPMFPQLNAAYERYETELEVEFSAMLVNGEKYVNQYPLYRRFVGLLSSEVKLLNVMPGDHVAVIGSGPFPISAIILANVFGTRVTAVECHRDSADLSEQVIRKLGLQNVVHVVCGFGQDLVASNVSAAIIALLAKPKDAILKNIFRNYAHCTSVICRTSHGIRQALYAPAEMHALEPYKVARTQQATGDQTISSILLARSEAKTPVPH
jgi:hypothetical protein